MRGEGGGLLLLLFLESWNRQTVSSVWEASLLIDTARLPLCLQDVLFVPHYTLSSEAHAAWGKASQKKSSSLSPVLQFMCTVYNMTHALVAETLSSSRWELSDALICHCIENVHIHIYRCTCISKAAIVGTVSLTIPASLLLYVAMPKTVQRVL